MAYILQFRDELEEIIGKELDQLVAALNASQRRIYDDLSPAVKAHCVIFNDVVQLIPTATETNLNFNRTDIDPQGMHQVAAGINYIAVVQEAGFYQVVARVAFANGAGDRYVIIYKNGVSVSTVQSPACAAIDTVLICTHHGNFALGDSIGVRVWQNTGGNLNVGNATRYASNELVVTQLF